MKKVSVTLKRTDPQKHKTYRNDELAPTRLPVPATRKNAILRNRNGRRLPRFRKPQAINQEGSQWPLWLRATGAARGRVDNHWWELTSQWKVERGGDGFIAMDRTGFPFPSAGFIPRRLAPGPGGHPRRPPSSPGVLTCPAHQFRRLTIHQPCRIVAL